MSKKLATLLLTALVTLGANGTKAYAAEEEKTATVIYEGSYELPDYRATPLKVKADQFTNLATGDQITVTFTVGTAQNYGTIDFCYGTTKLVCSASKTNTKKDGNFATTATETTVTVTDDADIAGLKSKGLQLKGKNVTISKIVLGGGGAGPDNPDPIDPDPVDPSDMTDLWTGSVNTGKWAEDITIDADVFAPYKGGDILTVFLTVNDGASYGGVEIDAQPYVKLSCDGTAKELDSYGCVQPGVSKLTYIITNSDMELLKASGLRFKGSNVTVTRIAISIGEALPDDPIEEGVTVLWTGNVNTGKWASNVTVPAEKFTDAMSGNNLILYVTKNQRVQYGEIELQDQQGNTLAVNGKGTNLDESGHLPGGVDNVVYTLGEEDVNLLKASGLLVKGMAVTLTKITLDSKQAGVSLPEAETDDSQEKVYYNLQGIQVENPGSGIYLVRTGSTVKKVIIR